MKALAAATLAIAASSLPAAAEPTFSTGGACPASAASHMPASSRQVLLTNPAKVYLAATLYRQIDKPNFKYRDADGADRLLHFPYHYQVFIPPHGTGPIGCTKIFIGAEKGAAVEAEQTFVLQKTDYFLEAPSDLTDEARPFVGSMVGDAGIHLINLNATKTIHVTLDRTGGGSLTLDLAPQAVSAVTADVGAGSRARGGPVLRNVHF